MIKLFGGRIASALVGISVLAMGSSASAQDYSNLNVAGAVKALNGVRKEFRRELSRTLKLRSVPELHFRYDDSVDRGERIDALLREEPPKDADPA